MRPRWQLTTVETFSGSVPVCKLIKTSAKTGPHFVVFLRSCSMTATRDTEGGNEEINRRLDHGLYNLAVTMPHLANSCAASGLRSTSTNFPVEPNTKIADSAFSGPVYSNAWYSLPVATPIRFQISSSPLMISSDDTSRKVADSAEVAEDRVGRLSALLSRTDDPTEEFSWGSDFVVAEVKGLRSKDGGFKAFDRGWTPLSASIGRLPPSTYMPALVCPCSRCGRKSGGPTIADRASVSSVSIGLSLSELAGSKKCMTPFPVWTARACAEMAIS